ncbi:MAG: acylphosphatase [Candidatus Omnitrophica bacterium]|nr:acylphosphatase [Candidatus Omnitrophota bacterium]
MKRLHALFSGMVQGVGFRYTTERIARHFQVTGFVKNLRDGRVEVVAEGEEQELKDFLSAIREGELGSTIRDLEIEWETARGTYDKFGVAF